MRISDWSSDVCSSDLKCKRLRGTAFDPFGYTAERKMERALIDEYEARLRDMVAVLSPANHKFAVEAASLPAQIRGYGHVKEASVDLVRGLEASVVERFHNAAAPETNNDDNRVEIGRAHV